jgi:hypothetical protein
VSADPQNQPQSQPQAKKGPGAVNAKRVLGILGSIIRTVCAILAFILVVFVLFAVGSANPGNWLVELISGWAQHLTLGLTGLFQTGNPDYQVIADNGVPAVVWLVIGSVAGRILKRG